MEPMTIIMFGLIAVLIFFMFRNSRKRQAQQQEMQNNMRPGAEVMLQSGIYGTIESIDEDQNRAVIQSGSSTLVVHRNAIAQVVTAVDAPVEAEEPQVLAPDDDPAFGERLGAADDADASVENVDSGESTATENGDDQISGKE